MNTEFLALDNELRKFDWTFENSDDYRAWEKGEAHAKQIQLLIDTLVFKYKNEIDTIEEIVLNNKVKYGYRFKVGKITI